MENRNINGDWKVYRREDRRKNRNEDRLKNNKEDIDSGKNRDGRENYDGRKK